MKKLLGASLFWCLITPAFAWGFDAHRSITHYAVANLPRGAALYDTFSPLIGSLQEASLAPDIRRDSTPGEDIKHYLDADLLEPYPFTSFPLSRSRAEAVFGREELEQAGVAPWALQSSYRRLVDAFRSGDRQAVLTAAGDTAHYLEDLHVPYHTTENYDGQLTGNEGIHARFESEMIERFWQDSLFKPQTAPPLKDAPLAAAFEVTRTSYGFLKLVNQADLAVLARHEPESSAGTVAKQQMNLATLNVARFWLSAWVDAGRPELETLN
jgi:hypothetical protein